MILQQTATITVLVLTYDNQHQVRISGANETMPEVVDRSMS